MTWKLDPSEVFIGAGGGTTKYHSKPANTVRVPLVELTHLPTGISVSRSAAAGKYSRKEAAEIRRELTKALFTELENLVAAHLNVPGR